MKLEIDKTSNYERTINDHIKYDIHTEISKKSVTFPSQVEISKRMKKLITDMLSISPDRRPKYLDVK